MTAAADRHLLFGLLALQNGLINQGQLVAAFQAWTLDKSRSLADHLEARGDLDRRPRAVEALAAVHLNATAATWKRAWPRSRPASRRRRAWRGSATRTSRRRSAMSAPHIPTRLEDGDPDRTSAYSVGTATSDGQRFRVLRPHARGGLGAVFVALDAELNREVALKQILDHHADDPTSRQRFLIEAEITGGLEHPGIVPVYGLGTYGNGRPYYAMRFIKGDSLKEAIELFHGEEARQGWPGPTVARAAQAPAADSPTSATRSTTPTAGACCTGTSSRPTSSSASTARRWSSTGAWQSLWAGSSRGATPKSGCWCRARPAAAPTPCPGRRWGPRPT